MPVIIALRSFSCIEMLLRVKKIGINQRGKSYAHEKFSFQLGTKIRWNEIMRNSLQLWYRAFCSGDSILHGLICHTFPDVCLKVRPCSKAAMVSVNEKCQEACCFRCLCKNCTGPFMIWSSQTLCWILF